jgi:hypothetical protein
LQLLVRVESEIEIARQVFLAKLTRDIRHSLLFRRGGVNQTCFLAGNPRDKEISEVPRELAAEVMEAAAVALQLIHYPEHSLSICVLQRPGDFMQRIQREHPEQLSDVPSVQVCAAARDCLIERRERVAHRAFAGLSNDAQRFIIGGDAFLRADPTHTFNQFLERNGAKAELLATGCDGDGNLV